MAVFDFTPSPSARCVFQALKASLVWRTVKCAPALAYVRARIFPTSIRPRFQRRADAPRFSGNPFFIDRKKSVPRGGASLARLSRMKWRSKHRMVPPSRLLRPEKRVVAAPAGQRADLAKQSELVIAVPSFYDSAIRHSRNDHALNSDL